VHFVSAISNAGPFHEFKSFGDDLPVNSKSSSPKSENGSLTVPGGAKLGVDFDSAYIKKTLI
jgi:hypothetical protein